MATMRFQILGSTDEVTTCDCCGKTGLKATWAVRLTETGDVVYYGSTCVTRNTAIRNPEKAAADYKTSQMKAASIQLRQSDEWRHLEARFALRQAMHIIPGKPSMDFVRAESEALSAKKAEIALVFGLQPYEIF